MAESGVPPAVAPGRRASATALMPGLFVAAIATMAAAFLADHYQAPLTLMALLIGMAANFLNADPRLGRGLDFAAGPLLKAGIILLGARITFAEMGEIGAAAFTGLVVGIVLTLAFSALLGRLLGYGSAFGVLAGGAVAICGASAALAIAALLGARRVGREQLTLVLVGTALASALAMVLYPLLAGWLGFTDGQAGYLTGAAIHDVAQALGAGFSISPEAGETATIVKLSRVALLAPLLAILALIFRDGGDAKKRPSPPWFVLGFLAVAGINSLGYLPADLVGIASTAGAALLAGAVAANGVRSPLADLAGQGPKALGVTFGASIALAAMATFTAAFLVPA